MPLLGFDSFAGVLWTEPRPHIQRMDGLSSEDCSQAYLSRVFKTVASVNLPLLWIYIIFCYKKGMKQKDKERKGGRQDYRTW